MFKKRAQAKKINLTEDANQIVVQKGTDNNLDQINQSIANQTKSLAESKKVNRFIIKEAKPLQIAQVETQHDKKVQMGLVPKHNVQYGLIEKDQGEKNKVQNNQYMDMYIKQKMKQYKKKQQPKVSSKMQTASEIFQMQRKYLQPSQQKIASYDVGQIQKKLQVMSAELIKSQQQKRAQYLKNLLQNELQRMEYASKKQLKMMRQQKQRDQKYLQANYREEGRRYQMNKLKQQSFKNLFN